MSDHFTPLLKTLLWLPVFLRGEAKALTVLQARHDLASPYLSELGAYSSPSLILLQPHVLFPKYARPQDLGPVSLEALGDICFLQVLAQISPYQ